MFFWSKKAYEQLDILPYLISKRVFDKINRLVENPLLFDVKKVVGIDQYRLRIGDYRVLFKIDVKESRIVISKIGHRKNIYKRI